MNPKFDWRLIVFWIIAYTSTWFSTSLFDVDEGLFHAELNSFD